jgi:hypothetical protein
VALAGFALAVAGCKAHIGSACTVSTDCSPQGNRVCDTAQPEGYCTELNCTDNTCPDSAVCVLFNPSVPGCAYSDYSAPGRIGLSFCMAHCGSDSDCRQDEGYVCANPRGQPWYAAILDDNQNQSVCIAASPSQVSIAPPSTTGACGPTLPPIPEAGGEAPIDASASGEGSAEGASAESSTDAVSSSADGVSDVSIGESDGSSDAMSSSDAVSSGDVSSSAESEGSSDALMSIDAESDETAPSGDAGVGASPDASAEASVEMLTDASADADAGGG